MSDSEGKALTPAPVSHELAMMGTRQEVRELVRRIQTQAPGGMMLTPTECVTLAQYSFSMGANPLVGEAWLLKNQKTGEVLGLMPGIRLYRRRADEKDERTGDSRWTEPEVITDPDDRMRLGIPNDVAIAVRVRLYRQSQTKAYAEAAEKLAKAGAPWGDIKIALGLKPYIEGVGYITKSEKEALDRAGDRNKMPMFQRVEKRAEAHALKQAYSLPFGFVPLAAGVDVPDGATLDDYILEGEFKELPDERTDEERKASAEKGKEDLFGTGETRVEPPAEVKPEQEAKVKQGRPMPAEILRDMLRKKAEKIGEITPQAQKFVGLVTGVLNRCLDGDDKKRHSFLKWIFDVDSMKALSAAEIEALHAWLNWTSDTGGEISVAPFVVAEAQEVLRVAMIAAGQSELPEGKAA